MVWGPGVDGVGTRGGWHGDKEVDSMGTRDRWHGDQFQLTYIPCTSVTCGGVASAERW